MVSGSFYVARYSSPASAGLLFWWQLSAYGRSSNALTSIRPQPGVYWSLGDPTDDLALLPPLAENTASRPRGKQLQRWP
jgi:hypothetical protein